MQFFDSPIHCKVPMIFGCKETMIIHVFTIRSPPISSHSQHQRGDKQVAEGPHGQFQKLEPAVPVALTRFKSFLVFGLRTRFFWVGFRVVFVSCWGLVYSGLFVLVVRSLLCAVLGHVVTSCVWLSLLPWDISVLHVWRGMVYPGCPNGFLCVWSSVTTSVQGLKRKQSNPPPSSARSPSSSSSSSSSLEKFHAAPPQTKNHEATQAMGAWQRAHGQPEMQA